MFFKPKTVNAVVKQFNKAVKHLERLQDYHNYKAVEANIAYVHHVGEADTAKRVRDKLADLVS